MHVVGWGYALLGAIAIPLVGPEANDDGERREAGMEAFAEIAGVGDGCGGQRGNQDNVGRFLLDLIEHFAGKGALAGGEGTIAAELKQLSHHDGDKFIGFIMCGEA